MLEMKNVCVTLEAENGKIEVLKNISITLDENKFYVMTGPNGGGKSSIAKTIMGIYQPTSGQIILDGVDITNMDIHERAKLGIGCAFQQPPRFKGLTVRDLLEIASGTASHVSQCDLLYDVGLCAQDYLDRELGAGLSGGEMKRIEIATLLARELKAAIFDEPEAGIDLWSFQILTETFKNMRHSSKAAIVIISHQERIIQLADEVIIVADGRISEITTKDKVLNDINNLDSECPYRKECGRGGRVYAE